MSTDLPRFRESIRAFIAENVPSGLADVHHWGGRAVSGPSLTARYAAMRHPLYQQWERACMAAGYVCPEWPAEHGGQSWSALQKLIWESELLAAGVPPVFRGFGDWVVGPAIIAHGTPEQQRRLLPRIISGDHCYCQGFSEPDNGSDLAGVQTRGVVDGDELVITGTKIWTSGALESNRIFLICRTSTERERHQGLSLVVADLGESERVTIRPIRQMTGVSEFAEVHFNGLHIPLADVIGGLGNGWRVAMTAMGAERGFNLPLLAEQFLAEWTWFVNRARQGNVEFDGYCRDRLAWAYSHVAILRELGMRAATAATDAADIAQSVAITKLFWSEYHKWFAEFAVDVLGIESLVRPDIDPAYHLTDVQEMYLASRPDTIYSGTSQIQRNIISERALGLPKS